MGINLTKLSHDIISAYFKDKPIFCAVDATVGNGHDTLFLAQNMAKCGIVYGFDVQKQAVESCLNLLRDSGKDSNAMIFLDGHQNMSKRVGTDFMRRICNGQFKGVESYENLERQIGRDKILNEADFSKNLENRTITGIVDCIVFNLGWLPKSDKSIITKSETTIEALSQSLSLMNQDAIMNVLSYRAHEGGREEFESVENFFALHESRISLEKYFDSGNVDSPVLFSIKMRKNVKKS